MQQLHRRFDDLDLIIDDVHALFDMLEEEGGEHIPLDYFALQVLKLAVHEWVANLVQHANFDGVEPSVRLLLVPDGARVRCVIEDNSGGFDFASQSEHQRSHLESAPHPPDRGRGLLMMIACTENLSYGMSPSGSAGGDGFSCDGWYRLEFWISPHVGGDGSIEHGETFDGSSLTATPTSLATPAQRVDDSV
jgi:serine/threonine-protein kinase RsbW